MMSLKLLFTRFGNVAPASTSSIAPPQLAFAQTHIVFVANMLLIDDAQSFQRCDVIPPQAFGALPISDQSVSLELMLSIAEVGPKAEFA